MTFVVAVVRTVCARGEGLSGRCERLVGLAVVVWRVVASRLPSVHVDVVMVGVVEVFVVMHVGVWVVGGHCPCECGVHMAVVEPEVACRVVVCVARMEPYTAEVDGHVDFFAGIGVESVDPDLIIG